MRILLQALFTFISSINNNNKKIFSKKLLLLFMVWLVCALIFPQRTLAQNAYSISFEKDRITISKSKTEDKIYQITFKATSVKNKDLLSYKVAVLVNQGETTLPAPEYKVDFKETALNEVEGNNTVYIILKKDSIADRQRKIVLQLLVKNGDGKEDETTNNTGDNKKIEVFVDGIKNEDSLKGYNYMAYVGTNFDLVDGVKASNLFFAANIFLPPVKRGSKVGAYLSLYGNRTMSQTDSTGTMRRLYRIARVTDTSYVRYTEQARLVRTRVSDNLGAYINPLIRLWGASNPDNSLQLYYSPSLEFVWRRTQTTSVFSNSSNRDSVIEKGAFTGAIDFENTSVLNTNEYAFNAGFLGIFLVHESNNISMRVHASIGYTSNFYPTNQMAESNTPVKKGNDIFFSGRAWITEATTGLTLQAEVTNTAKYSRPFYGVTLSKALNFKHLGGIFSPVTSR